MFLDDGMLMLNVKLDNLMHLVEKYRNVNVSSSNYIVCVMYGGYHVDYQCIQEQHVDCFDGSEYGTSYVDYHGPNWGNIHNYGWYDHCLLVIL